MASWFGTSSASRCSKVRAGRELQPIPGPRPRVGTTIEEPFASEAYARRVQGVLAAVVARFRSNGPPAWVARYESEQAWHLDAHLRAVRYCDANLGSMTAASLAAQLESIGLRPLYEDARDRCEQLYTHVFEWSLARGDSDRPSPSTRATAQRCRPSTPSLGNRHSQ